MKRESKTGGMSVGEVKGSREGGHYINLTK